MIKNYSILENAFGFKILTLLNIFKTLIYSTILKYNLLFIMLIFYNCILFDLLFRKIRS